MKIKFAIISESAFTDAEGRLNIIQTFNIIRASSFPAIHPRLAIVTNIELDPKEAAAGTISQSTEIVHNDSEKILAKSEPVAMKVSQEKNVQFISNFIGLGFDKPGEYYVNLVIDKKRHSKIASFTVEKSL
ncbi:MAG: hypothetical protein AAB929_01245 [Patescibacteria group bacterium]